MGVEDVDVIEAHALQALVQARKQILARAPVAVGAVPHVVSGLGRDDQFVAIRAEIVVEDASEVFFRRTGRRPVVVRQIEVGDAEIEGAAQHGAAVFEGVHAAEVVPETEGDGGK